MNKLLKNNLLLTLLFALLALTSSGQVYITPNRTDGLPVEGLKRDIMLIEKDPIEAYEYAQSIVEKAVEQQDSILEIKGLDFIALIFSKAGLPSESLTYTYRALRTAEATKSTQYTHVLRNNLAKLFFDMGDYQQCLTTIRKSESLASNSLDSNYRTRLQLLKGITLLTIDSLKAATKQLTAKDFKPFLERFPLFQPTYYFYLGRLWQKKGLLDSARLFFNKSLALNTDRQQLETRIKSKLYLAEVLEATQQGTQAEQLLLTTQQEAKLSNADLLKKISRALADFYVRREQPLQAYEVLSSTAPLIDSLEQAEQALHRDLLKKRSEHQTTNVLKKRLKVEQERNAALNRTQWLYIFGIVLILAAGIFYLLWQKAKSSRRKRLAEFLQREVERSAQHNQELKSLNGQLESLNVLKNKLLSIVGHELRNPISNLKNVLELMDSGDLSKEEEQELRKSLSEELSGTALLLENLLRWSKNQLKGITFNPKTVKLSQLIENNITLLSWQAERKSINVSYEVPPDMHAYVDVEMINIVLKNLLTNAFKFTDEQGTVTIKARSSEQDQIRIEVSDSGRGIPEADQAKLFTLKVKSRPGTAAEPGTGLGLLLCREFVERNGGSIWIKSSLGEGATFIFVIPKADTPSFVED